MLPVRFLKALLLSISLLTLTACNEYWWTRGQPPSAEEILNRALARVIEIKSEYENLRPDISSAAEALSSKITNFSTDNLPNILDAVEMELSSLEGKLSYGNRAPYNELCGQLRAMSNNKNKASISKDALNLYFARVLFFLSSEMKVPAPDKLTSS